MRPEVVKEGADPEGRVVSRGEPKELRRTISPKTSAQMREILGKVVQEDGTGTQARIKGFLVGGKKGAAPKGGGGGAARAIGEETGPYGIRMSRVALGPGGGALVMPDLQGISMGRVVDLMGRYSVKIRLVGTGLARAQAPAPGAILAPGTEVTVSFGAEQGEK